MLLRTRGAYMTRATFWQRNQIKTLQKISYKFRISFLSGKLCSKFTELYTSSLREWWICTETKDGVYVVSTKWCETQILSYCGFGLNCSTLPWKSLRAIGQFERLKHRKNSKIKLKNNISWQWKNNRSMLESSLISAVMQTFCLHYLTALNWRTASRAKKKNLVAINVSNSNLLHTIMSMQQHVAQRLLMVLEHLYAIVTKIYNNDCSFVAYTYTWRTIKLTRGIAVYSKLAEEVSIGLEDLNSMILWVSNDDVSLLVHGDSLRA